MSLLLNLSNLLMCGFALNSMDGLSILVHFPSLIFLLLLSLPLSPHLLLLLFYRLLQVVLSPSVVFVLFLQLLFKHTHPFLSPVLRYLLFALFLIIGNRAFLSHVFLYFSQLLCFPSPLYLSFFLHLIHFI